MKPDISKIVVGSRVTFEVTKMDVDRLNDSQVMLVGIEQIISIEPPVFDWSSVKPGMRFFYIIGPSKSVCRYVGPDLDATERAVVMFHEGELISVSKSDLTPAPEGE